MRRLRPACAPPEGCARVPPCAGAPTTSRASATGAPCSSTAERVDDVTRHPAFAESVQRIAERYDAASESPDVTTCLDPATGKRIGAMWLIPRSAEDLGRRRAVHRFWAEGSYGLMGRTPDHVASVLTAFAGWRQLFDRGGRQYGDNVVRFYEKARDEDLYLAYAIVPPQIDRTTPAHQHPEPFLHPGVVKETDAGIVIRGAHSIATSVTMADWLYVSYITPLAPGDVDYAISLVVPVNARGAPAPAAPALRDARDERLRLPALRALRRGGHHRRLRRRVRALGAGLRLPERGAGDRAVPRIARARDRELPVAGALRGQARAAGRPRPEAGRGRARRGGRQHPGDPRRRHRHVLRRLRRAGAGGRAPPARERRATRARIRSTSTRG